MTYDERQLRSWIERYAFRNRLDGHDPSAPIITAAKGSLVWDITGREYIDFNSGQMCSALGHNHEAIIAAINKACETVIHASSTFYNIAEILLSAKLAERSPAPLEKSFFMSSGSDANNAAMAVARAYTGGYEVASPHVSFHGLAEGTRAVTYAGWRKHVGPFAPGYQAMFAPYCYRCPLRLTYPDCGLACVDASFELLDAQSTGKRAAVITETLFSAGGVIEAPAGWLKKVEEKCRERGMLLIVDESQTGLAKLGTFYSFTETGAAPDLVTISKHFGGGVDISAVIARPEIEEKVIGEGFIYSHSHSSDPLACWAALASLEIIEQENLQAKALEIGAYWHRHLKALQDEFEMIGDVRGRGLLQGIEFVEDRETRAPSSVGKAVQKWCLENGLIFSSRREGSVLRFVPPFTTTREQMDRAAEILRAGMKAAGVR